MMYVIAIHGWVEGFGVNRLVALFREYQYPLADAFRISSEVAEGTDVTIPFQTLKEADEFAQAARQIGLQLELRLPANLAS